MRSRGDEIATFFTEKADRLQQGVARRVSGVARATVEDACAFAWMQLVRRDDVTIDERAFWWLHRIAIHEAWRLAAISRVELAATARHGADGEPVIERVRSALDVEQHVIDRQRLEALAELPDRRRRVLLLHAYGFTYVEIARMTGDTRRTIDRQLRHARQQLADAAAHGLASRERQTLEALADGLTISDIALRLGVSRQTVGDYVTSLYRKLGVRTRAEAISASCASPGREAPRGRV